MAKTIEIYEGMPVIEASDSKDLEKKLEKMEGIKPPFAVKIFRRTKIIKKDAFSSCTDIAAILIPDSVTNIGDRAFEDCEGLTSVNIGNSVTEIGNGAFS